MSRSGEAQASVRPGRGSAVLVVALCAAHVGEDEVLVDQKFHTGMLGYAHRLPGSLRCILPRMPGTVATVPPGMVRLGPSALPYRVITVSGTQPGAADEAIIDGALEGVGLAYIGEGTALNAAVARRCRERGVPYVVTTECTLRTTIDIMRAETPSAARRLVREARLRWWGRSRRVLLSQAAEIHANGYPTFQELEAVNPRRLLFFDTRASAADVVAEDAIARRLDSLDHRRPRLIFSGRYIPMKGALDVIRVAVEVRRLGVAVDLATYGAGLLRDPMRELAQREGAGAWITVNDPVPYRPDLIERTREADLFISCHVQGDPSCTYLETFACGVPVAGYGNEMWAALQRDSGAGVAVPVGDHRGLARAVAGLLVDRARLREASLRARSFALANTMEIAWDARTARMARLMAPRAPAGPTIP